jgi:hypothetical protein
MLTTLEKINCSRCGALMPKLRKDLYGYDFCTTCSDVKPKVGRIRVVGEGDHTVTELDILEQDIAMKLQEMENSSRGVKNVPLEMLSYDEEEITDDEKTLTGVVNKVLEDGEKGQIEEEEEDYLDEVEEVEEVDLEEDEEE